MMVVGEEGGDDDSHHTRQGHGRALTAIDNEACYDKTGSVRLMMGSGQTVSAGAPATRRCRYQEFPGR